MFEAYAISFDIRLKLVINGTVRFNTSGKSSALERYQSVFNNVLRQNAEINIQEDNFKVQGHLSTQNEMFTQQHLFIFINGKYIQNPEFYQCINQVYRKHSAIYKASGLIFVEVSPRRVDFNTSNDKLLVKIMGVQQIINQIRAVYERMLSENASQVLPLSSQSPPRASQ